MGQLTLRDQFILVLVYKNLQLSKRNGTLKYCLESWTLKELSGLKEVHTVVQTSTLLPGDISGLTELTISMGLVMELAHSIVSMKDPREFIDVAWSSLRLECACLTNLAITKMESMVSGLRM